MAKGRSNEKLVGLSIMFVSFYFMALILFGSFFARSSFVGAIFGNGSIFSFILSYVFFVIGLVFYMGIEKIMRMLRG